MCTRSWSVIALTLATLLCLHTTALSGTAQDRKPRCSTAQPTLKTLKAVQARVASQQQNAAAGSAFNVTIPVVWHVIFANSSGLALKVGKQRKRLDLVIAQMNADYNKGAPAGYQYKFVSAGPTLLHKISRSESNFAFCGFNILDDSAETRARFRRGDACTLNLYIIDSGVCGSFAFGFGALGASSYPWTLQVQLSADGVLLDPAGLPGFNVTPQHITSHEVGHWFGLLHTFQYDFTTSLSGNDGCKDPWGDFVADTPKEQEAHFGGLCSDALVFDSCPLDKGKDPWWNQMSYFDCEKQYFSKGQHARMRTMHTVLRQPYCLPPPTPQQGPIKFGPDCSGSRVVNGTAKGCCDTTQGLFCYEYKEQDLFSFNSTSTYASCMTPSACRATAASNPLWDCTRKAACHK